MKRNTLGQLNIPNSKQDRNNKDNSGFPANNQSLNTLRAQDPTATTFTSSIKPLKTKSAATKPKTPPRPKTGKPEKPLRRKSNRTFSRLPTPKQKNQKYRQQAKSPTAINKMPNKEKNQRNFRARKAKKKNPSGPTQDTRSTKTPQAKNIEKKPKQTNIHSPHNFDLADRTKLNRRTPPTMKFPAASFLTIAHEPNQDDPNQVATVEPVAHPTLAPPPRLMARERSRQHPRGYAVDRRGIHRLNGFTTCLDHQSKGQRL